jgi:hypothetical protein
LGFLAGVLLEVLPRGVQQDQKSSFFFDARQRLDGKNQFLVVFFKT